MSDNVPENLKYTKEHEWARQDGSVIVVGITAHAVNTLGDIVFLELPKVGTVVTADATFGVVESVKAVSDLYAPLSGKVVKVNEEAVSDPETLNEDCYGDGWLIHIEPSDSKQFAGLLDAKAYQELLK